MGVVALPPFQTLLDEHRRDVHRFLVSMVGAHDADDALQETFISALRAYPRLRDDSNLRGWLFTIAHRKALDLVRARRRGPVAVETLPEQPVWDGRPSDADPALWSAVHALPPK